ncbi:MAG: PQQ-binding-like beta-propeller repeat protein [Verrucomicrobia bacterium]|nr:PQQ-binding-like beta-propeller repeat protein [Verrucomicrobiota bacterium]
MKGKKLVTVFFVTLFQCQLMTSADPWNQFRGPNGSGVALKTEAPLELIPSHAVWNTPIPVGHSSPIKTGNSIFLTGQEGGLFEIIALEARNGGIKWRRKIPVSQVEKVHAANSLTSSTPCSDGEYVYVYLGSYGLLCYDMNGNLKWEKRIPTPKSLYGMSTSPILYKDSVILVLDDDQNLPDSQLSRSKVIAVDKSSGINIWETPRPYNRSNWSTPMIWRHDQGNDLVVLGNGRIYGYEPATGNEKWYVNGFSRETIAIPVAGAGKLFASSSMRGGRGDLQLDPEPFWNAVLQFDANSDQKISTDEMSHYFTIPLRPELPIDHPGFGIPLPFNPEARKKRQKQFFDWRDQNSDGLWTKEEYFADMSIGSGRPLMAAILPGGSGDITESEVAWELRRGIPEIPSPVYHDQRVYLLRDGGILSCVNAGNGESFYRERLNAPGQYTASPIVTNDHIYCFSQQGKATVIQTGDVFKITSQSELGASITATPAIDTSSIYVRTSEGLIAFRETNNYQNSKKK